MNNDNPIEKLKISLLNECNKCSIENLFYRWDPQKRGEIQVKLFFSYLTNDLQLTLNDKEKTIILSILDENNTD